MRVLFIDIDTLRPDHMSCYGYVRKTTPNIDEVCKEGTRFDRYFTSDAPCLPSRASLISGVFGFRNRSVGHGGTAADRRIDGPNRRFRNSVDEGNFHNIFRKAGMKTVSISTFPERHSLWWFNAGLNETYNIGKGGHELGEDVLPIALDWLDREGKNDNWYMHFNIWDPHTPYRTPDYFGEPFSEEPLDEWYTKELFDEHKKHVGPHSIQETDEYGDSLEGYPRHPYQCKNMTDYKKYLDGYDTGILYADYIVGKVFDKIKELGIYDDTAIIVTSDHGENMGELGIYAEHSTANKSTCNIPMIIKWPGIEGGKSDNALHYSLDLLPTLADLLNVKHSSYWDGKSYKDSLVGKSLISDNRESLVISQNAHVCQRSAVFGDYIYIRTIHDGHHLFDKEMLFNLKNDPHEQNDVKDCHPDICAKGAKIILDWQEEQMLKDPKNCDPLWIVMSEGGPEHSKCDLKKYIERLKATQREEGANILEKRYF